MKVVFFNQPWLERRYRPGTRLALYGKYDGRNSFKVSSHSETLDVGAAVDGIAHYPATEGITSTQLAEMVRAHRTAIGDVIEPLSAALRVAERLPDRPAALADMHFGDGEPGRVRLAFDELLFTQLLFARRRALHAAIAAPALDGPRRLTARWLADALPFAPTGDQTAAMEAVEADLARPRPMQRLLMGEVGSRQDRRGAVRPPAGGRARDAGRVHGPDRDAGRAALRHAAEPARRRAGLRRAADRVDARGRRADVLGKLGSGELSLVVGTHALIEPAVVFDRLAVAVVDEQHRFGVRQRSALDAKGRGDGPHVLHMTATPIPRRCACSIGDLEHTAIHELPGGRKPIRTFVASTDAERERAYERIREELRAGARRSSSARCRGVRGAAGAGGDDRVRAPGRRRAVGLRARPAARADAPAREAGGDGVVRGGRRGRAAWRRASSRSASTCPTRPSCSSRTPSATASRSCTSCAAGSAAAATPRCASSSAEGSKRLRALAEHADGFRLAEIDLELRREGELVGTRQSGYGEFDVARLPEDEALLERARRRAADLLASTELQRPENALLADALRERYGAAELDLPIRRQRPAGMRPCGSSTH